MENKNKNFKKFLRKVSDEKSSKGQSIHLNPSITNLFQTFSLSIQQQQNNNRKETLTTKTLQTVINKINQFNKKNISKYLKYYVRKMKLNRVSEKKIITLFKLTTILKIKNHITSITNRYKNS
ncbi:hypothetical protein GCM10010252_78120 [Streptomyces aureoverticillatus]|nr:hypothetical protein GCM10010252_78120 [Streptomyces aureoverticillatus]